MEEFLGSDGALGFVATLLGLSDIVHMIGERIHAIVNEAVYVELGPGYWITAILLGCMILAEAAAFLKNRIHIPLFRSLATSAQEQS